MDDGSIETNPARWGRWWGSALRNGNPRFRRRSESRPDGSQFSALGNKSGRRMGIEGEAWPNTKNDTIESLDRPEGGRNA